MNTTYSLSEVATGLRLFDEMKDPVRWLTTQIKSGKITARRIGRSWRMTQADIDRALEVFASKPARPVEAEPRGGPTAASMRGRLAAAS